MTLPVHRHIAPGRKILRYPEALVAWRERGCLFPLNVELDLSNACDENCRGCAFRSMHGDQHLSVAMAKSVFEQAAALGVRGMVLSGGGEPTQNPDFAEIVRLASEQPFRLGIYTNGKRMAEFGDWVWSAFEWVYCSLVPPPLGLPRRCPSTVFGRGELIDAETIDRIPRRASRFLCESECRYLQFRPRVEPEVDPGWVRDAMPELLRWDGLRQGDRYVDASVAKFRDYLRGRDYSLCRTCRMVGMIGCDGTVWQCVQRRGVTAVGRLDRESLREAWERLPWEVPVDHECRVSCRNDALNRTMEELFGEGARHGEFV